MQNERMLIIQVMQINAYMNVSKLYKKEQTLAFVVRLSQYSTISARFAWIW
jgi:GTP cyclohydrolase III